MKKFYFLGFIVLFSGSLMAQTATLPSGSGTSIDPYLIATLDNLYWVTQNSDSWSSYFSQTANIDASSTSGWSGGFSPIGNSETYFMGSYDGQGHTIIGLYINSNSPYVGFIGVAVSSSVSNLGLLNVNITTGTATTNTGGLAGVNTGTINSCGTSGTVSGGAGSIVGALVGQNQGGAITYSYSNATINCSEDGGLVAENTSGATISKCRFGGSVNGTGSADYGGIAGYASGGGISNCYSTGSVTGGTESEYVGGLVGEDVSENISNCYSAGLVTGSGYVGGLVGNKEAGPSVGNSFWDKQTSGQGSSSGGTGETTLSMKTESIFTDAGWDFTAVTGVWSISGGINNGYPTLQGLATTHSP